MKKGYAELAFFMSLLHFMSLASASPANCPLAFLERTVAQSDAEPVKPMPLAGLIIGETHFLNLDKDAMTLHDLRDPLAAPLWEVAINPSLASFLGSRDQLIPVTDPHFPERMQLESRHEDRQSLLRADVVKNDGVVDLAKSTLSAVFFDREGKTLHHLLYDIKNGDIISRAEIALSSAPLLITRSVDGDDIALLTEDYALQLCRLNGDKLQWKKNIDVRREKRGQILHLEFSRFSKHRLVLSTSPIFHGGAEEANYGFIVIVDDINSHENPRYIPSPLQDLVAIRSFVPGPEKSAIPLLAWFTLFNDGDQEYLVVRDQGKYHTLNLETKKSSAMPISDDQSVQSRNGRFVFDRDAVHDLATGETLGRVKLPQFPDDWPNFGLIALQAVSSDGRVVAFYRGSDLEQFTQYWLFELNSEEEYELAGFIDRLSDFPELAEIAPSGDSTKLGPNLRSLAFSPDDKFLEVMATVGIGGSKQVIHKFFLTREIVMRGDSHKHEQVQIRVQFLPNTNPPQEFYDLIGAFLGVVTPDGNNMYSIKLEYISQAKVRELMKKISALEGFFWRFN